MSTNRRHCNLSLLYHKAQERGKKKGDRERGGMVIKAKEIIRNTKGGGGGGSGGGGGGEGKEGGTEERAK